VRTLFRWDSFNRMTSTETLQMAVTWRGHYKAWGAVAEVISEAAKKTGIRNPIRFQGQYFDSETGLHYNRHRYYDPHTGRFISKDPIGLAGGLNAYQYAPNPLRWIDPLGLAAGDGGQTWGTAKPIPTGAAPESIYTKTDSTGIFAVQNTVYDENGAAIGQVDFKNHGGCACSGHGHVIHPPGNLRGGHGATAVHILPNDVPQEWSAVPPGITPATPIGQ
jgi:RHS repeat-associated protein